MTNREWLETLSDEMLASEISTRCGLCTNHDVNDCWDCASNITTWLTQEYVPPQKECLYCKRYWRDSYERKGGDAE